MAVGRAYGRGPLKRSLDLALTIPSLLVALPVLALLAALVVLLSGWPILYRQVRVGRDGRPFILLKFRTMRRGSAGGPQITSRGDARVTRVGRMLRATKLDELPQLFNILRGDMSVVGPRPEVPRYVDRYTPEQRRVLEVRPGLTDLATLEYRNEEVLLARVAEGEREAHYVGTILPRKLALNLDYISRASLGFDLMLLFRTVGAILLPRRA